MNRAQLLASVALAASLFACGGSAEHPDGSGASGGSGGSGASGGSGGAGGDACDVPKDMSGPTVTVRLVNKTGQNLYLANPELTCEPYRAFEVMRGTETLKPFRNGCEPTCSEFRLGECGCVASCAAPFVTLLAPEGVYTSQWNGSVYSPSTILAECVPDSCPAGACLYQEPAVGPLTLVGGAYFDVKGCEPGPCSCTPGADGTCELDSTATVSGTEVKAMATVEQVTPSTVDIVFDVLPGG